MFRSLAGAARAMKARGPRALRRLREARGGQVAIIFSLLVPVIALLIAGVIDASYALNARTQLQDANDEASLAVSVAVAQNPNATVASLKTVAQNAVSANFPAAHVTITDFHVCAPIQADCTDGSTTMANGTVKLAVSAPTACTMAAIVPMFCTGGSTQTANASTTTNIKFGYNLQLNIVMDSSASMIVGATPADVTTSENWTDKTQANWLSVKVGDPAPYTGQDNPQCAFACHDEGSNTTPADIALGLTRANAAGATTRFDVMTSAATQLIKHVQSVATGNTLNRTNTYLFNVMSFDAPRSKNDTSLHTYGANNMNYAAALSAVATVSPGLDTYIDDAMSSLVTQLGTNGTGASAASPLKFVILVTDGLKSDRNSHWNCGSNPGWETDPAWGGNMTACVGGGGYDAPLSLANCTALKNAGIVVGVLETPYVPLKGQSPNIEPYERTVQNVIYPGGAGSASTVSNALSQCASPGYYFQAVNSTDISTGFVTLTDQFLARSAAIVR